MASCEHLPFCPLLHIARIEAAYAALGHYLGVSDEWHLFGVVRA